MALDFLKYAAKGNAFVNQVAEELQVPRDKAARLVRSVLHALRNRLLPEESFQLLSQLPMALKSVYVDGWNPFAPFERIRKVDDFLEEIRKEDGGQAGYDLGNDQQALLAASVVMKVLHDSMSEGGFEGLVQTLPNDYQAWINEIVPPPAKISSSL